MFLISPRWQKILNDILGNKTRSLLVILSISVGVGVVGIINNGRYLIERDIKAGYERGNPASLQIYTSPIQIEEGAALEGMSEISFAQIRRIVSSIVTGNDGIIIDTTLVIVPDFDDITVGKFDLSEGKLVPGLREIILEAQSAEAFNVELGDIISVEMNSGNSYKLRVAGIVNDIYEIPYSIRKVATGYLSMSTLQWMGDQPFYNRIDIVVAENNHDREYVLSVGMKAKNRVLEPAGIVVGSVQIPGIDANPGEHWANNQIQGFVLILQVMSVMAIFLSGGLVVNTISAILTQQVRQIGIMRSIGGVPKQIISMYVFNIFVFSLIAWAISIPIGLFGSWGLALFAAGFLNFQLTTMNLSPSVFLLQTIIAMVVPIGVAFGPILAGTSIKIYDAIYQHGIVDETNKPWLEKFILKWKQITPPIALSLLNTFRNVPRLVFTVITLTLAGATFIATFSTQASLNAQIEGLARAVYYDVQISTSYGVDRYTAEREAYRIPGVWAAEGWANTSGNIQNKDGTDGEEVGIYGISPDTKMLDIKMLAGRWLSIDDNMQVVINQDYAAQFEGVELGSSISIKINGKIRDFKIVGIITKHLSGARVYVNYPVYSKIVAQNHPINILKIRTNPDEIASIDIQEDFAIQLEERMENAGLSKSKSQTNHQAFGFFSDSFDIIIVVLVIMAALLAIVGGLSLAGTMGINVMERTREIGVLRSVGASNGAVRQVVLVEGITIAVMSWLIAMVLSAPAGAGLAAAVIQTVLNTNLIYRYSFKGLLYWLIIVIFIGMASSLAPAQNAVKLTVREVLDYE